MFFNYLEYYEAYDLNCFLETAAIYSYRIGFNYYYKNEILMLNIGQELGGLKLYNVDINYIIRFTKSDFAPYIIMGIEGIYEKSHYYNTGKYNRSCFGVLGGMGLEISIFEKSSMRLESDCSYRFNTYNDTAVRIKVGFVQKFFTTKEKEKMGAGCLFKFLKFLFF